MARDDGPPDRPSDAIPPTASIPDSSVPSSAGDATRILALHEALDHLAQTDPQKAELVKIRYFGGMTIPEAAKVLGISASSVDRQWTYARAWLHHQIKKGDTSP